MRKLINKKPHIGPALSNAGRSFFPKNSDRMFFTKGKMIQREEKKNTPGSSAQAPKIDWFAMREPYVNRGLFGIDSRDFQLIRSRWLETYRLGLNIGISPKLAETTANLLTPQYIDAGLKYDNPTVWEEMDRQLNTSSFVLSPTVLTFDLQNFGSTVDSPLRNLFGGKPRNPYNKRRP